MSGTTQLVGGAELLVGMSVALLVYVVLLFMKTVVINYFDMDDDDDFRRAISRGLKEAERAKRSR